MGQFSRLSSLSPGKPPVKTEYGKPSLVNKTNRYDRPGATYEFGCGDSQTKFVGGALFTPDEVSFARRCVQELA